MDLRTVSLGEGHERERVGLGAVHEIRELRELAAQLIGGQAPLPPAGVRARSVLGGVHHEYLLAPGLA